MDYRFKQIVLDLDDDTIGVVVIFYDETQISRIKTYYFKSEETTDVNVILDKTKIVIENERQGGI